MRINAINNVYPKQSNSSINTKRGFVKNQPLPQDSVSFKGIKNATKGGIVLGVLGAVAGAIVSGGTSIIPTILYFGACNAAVGAAAGAHIEDDKKD